MFTEVSILGVLVSPFVVMMFLAWLVVMPVTMVAARVRILNRMWHPGLFRLCLYVIALALIVIHVGDQP